MAAGVPALELDDITCRFAAPDGGENGADQHVDRAVAEGAAILAHGGAPAANLMMAGGVEQT